MRNHTRNAVAAACVAGALLISGASAFAQEPPPTEPTPTEQPTEPPAPEPLKHVLAITVDGFNPTAYNRIGAAKLPNITRLVTEGASTWNARTVNERTTTLPNTASMVTGAAVATAAWQGHGVNWNNDRGTTVREAAGRNVQSMFNIVNRSGGTSAVFSGKANVSLLKRSWPAAVRRAEVQPALGKLIQATKLDLIHTRRELTYLHIAQPDAAGHNHGFLSPQYLAAVERVDKVLGQLLQAIERRPLLRDNLAIVLTSDHGGNGRNAHTDATKRANFRVPFIVWGAGVDPVDLYAVNPTRANPGQGRIGYPAALQPVRNGEMANVVTNLLGLDPVADSRFNADHSLTWNTPAPPPTEEPTGDPTGEPTGDPTGGPTDGPS